MTNSADRVIVGPARVLAVVIIFVIGASQLQAQSNLPAPQYRFQSTSIPGATASEPIRQAFSAEAGGEYLDLGASLWAQQKDCFSCHTHGLYTAVRPELSPFLGDPPEEMRSFVVRQVKEIFEEKEYEGSAATRMAYIARGLAEWDKQFSDKTSHETDAALRYLFDELQNEDGSFYEKDRWPPLNSGTWHGSSMAAMAVATAPGWLDSVTDPALRQKVERLKNYLRTTTPKNDHQRMLLLWVTTRMPELFDKSTMHQWIEMIKAHQRDDGSWSTRSFADGENWGGGKKAEKLMAEPGYQDPPGDGYQTGLAVVVLRDSGVAATDPRIRKAVKWLRANQRESGRWWTPSLNVDSRFHYSSYGGTAYAMLALAKCGELERVPKVARAR